MNLLRLQADKKNGDGDSERGTSVITRTKPQVKKPSLYRVLLAE
jgi:ATP-dependent Clp protease adaptor protein ClpS